MKNSFRVISLVLVMVCFGLATSNTLLILHLVEHHKDKNHDCEHCPVCQQAVVNVFKAVSPDALLVKEPAYITIAVVCAIQFRAKEFKFLTPYTRAPPPLF
jgi:hypothetical protein